MTWFINWQHRAGLKILLDNSRKVAWEWWNDWNLYGVDFETGINNETYKYYIDFASKYGIEYVILDEDGCKLKADLFDVIPEINLPELVKYAGERNVGIILWAGYYAFNKDIEQLSASIIRNGNKGFKVDFMDRDDQLMVNFHYEAARIAAQYKMLLDFHGTQTYRAAKNLSECDKL